MSEVLFGLIMVLTFTGSISIAEAGHAEIRTMLIGALGCNLAWGLIDGILYLMGSLAEAGTGLQTLRALRRSDDPQEGQRLVAEALPPLIASILEPPELESMRRRLKGLPEPMEKARLSRKNLLGAAAVFLFVFVSTFPVVIPFIFMKDPVTALRVSNTVAVAMLFITGFAFGRIIGRRPWAVGISMVVLGLILVAITMALGG